VGRFAFLPRAAQAVRDAASTAGGVAKTFLTLPEGRSTSETSIDYGPGPAPATQTPGVADAWYKSYGRFAPKR
jgi:hypothetical protein